jgi:hypothetical protein
VSVTATEQKDGTPSSHGPQVQCPFLRETFASRHNLCGRLWQFLTCGPGVFRQTVRSGYEVAVELYGYHSRRLMDYRVPPHQLDNSLGQVRPRWFAVRWVWLRPLTIIAGGQVHHRSSLEFLREIDHPLTRGAI